MTGLEKENLLGKALFTFPWESAQILSLLLQAVSFIYKWIN